MAKVPAALWRNLVAVQIYGANTGVGKTVFSTLLGAHFGRCSSYANWKVHYIKPVSTGPLLDSDERYVHKFTGERAVTLYQYRKPVSPHIAALEAAEIPTDEHLTHLLNCKLEEAAHGFNKGANQTSIALVETAGGVLSPGPSGTPQADLYRPLRLPAILVGDHRLGGIASTISAAESLVLRGYDIDTVVCFDDRGDYKNASYLTKYFQSIGITTVTVPWIPDLRELNEEEEFRRMSSYYHDNCQCDGLQQIHRLLIKAHSKRIVDMESMALRTKEVIWHPFTQHKHVKNADEILVFDSAYGDYFQVKHTQSAIRSGQKHTHNRLLHSAFDGSASWWTQGLGHGNPALALQAAYAAGRYGHVMFAGATHGPAITLAERLLKGLNNPRLEKIFYTDNGSTATEVGLKMALRASCRRFEWDGAREDVGILGLKGSYHGDTIGAMDASEPCVFNEKADWYRGRGYWFNFPTFQIHRGQWIVQPPRDMESDFGPRQSFNSMDDIFRFDRRPESSIYEEYIRKTLDKLVKQEGRKFGALVMEPIVLGAGGMLFVDPLFQHSLVRVVRQYDFSRKSGLAQEDNNSVTWTGVPVMFDEVFTGLYRLGHFSAASVLGVDPDISVHAKLLTGGILPLAVTAASQSIFDAFLGDSKADALLHGHSYTAHPIGCHVANVSLDTMSKLDKGTTWATYKRSWQPEMTSKEATLLLTQNKYMSRDRLWSMWSMDFVLRLSEHERVAHVNALGSVLAVALVDESGSGYTSSAAVGLRNALLNQKSIHSRILGNVIYLIASMTSQPAQLHDIEHKFLAMLEQAL